MFSRQVMSDSLWPHGLQHTSFFVLCYLSKFAQIHVYWVSDAIQPSRFLSPLPSSFPSVESFPRGQLFTSDGQSFSFSISPSNEHSRLISFMTYWFLLSYKTKRLSIQHHSLKASVLWPSIFFMVQLSHSYITPWKIIDLTIWIFVDKVISLLFNRLHRFVIIFLPRN